MGKETKQKKKKRQKEPTKQKKKTPLVKPKPVEPAAAATVKVSDDVSDKKNSSDGWFLKPAVLLVGVAMLFLAVGIGREQRAVDLSLPRYDFTALEKLSGDLISTVKSLKTSYNQNSTLNECQSIINDLIKELSQREIVNRNHEKTVVKVGIAMDRFLVRWSEETIHHTLTQEWMKLWERGFIPLAYAFSLGQSESSVDLFLDSPFCLLHLLTHLRLIQPLNSTLQFYLSLPSSEWILKTRTEACLDHHSIQLDHLDDESLAIMYEVTGNEALHVFAGLPRMDSILHTAVKSKSASIARLLLSKAKSSSIQHTFEKMGFGCANDVESVESLRMTTTSSSSLVLQSDVHKCQKPSDDIITDMILSFLKTVAEKAGDPSIESNVTKAKNSYKQTWDQIRRVDDDHSQSDNSEMMIPMICNDKKQWKILEIVLGKEKVQQLNQANNNHHSHIQLCRPKSVRNAEELSQIKFWENQWPLIMRDELFNNLFGEAEDGEMDDSFDLQSLIQKHGDVPLMTSSVPYANLFGSEAHSIPLEQYYNEYLQKMVKSSSKKKLSEILLKKVNHTHERYNDDMQYLYAFDGGNALNNASVFSNGLTEMAIDLGVAGMTYFIFSEIETEWDLSSKAQFAFGPKGSGAPPHFHSAAFNRLFMGQKLWIMYEPRYSQFSKHSVRQWFADFFEDNLKNNPGITFLFLQKPGDVVFVPNNWGHAVINTQTSLAVALELSI